jgi:hypothetical protein
MLAAGDTFRATVVAIDPEAAERGSSDLDRKRDPVIPVAQEPVPISCLPGGSVNKWIIIWAQKVPVET